MNFNLTKDMKLIIVFNEFLGVRFTKKPVRQMTNRLYVDFKNFGRISKKF
jgi:hypothetical protein